MNLEDLVKNKIYVTESKYGDRFIVRFSHIMIHYSSTAIYKKSIIKIKREKFHKKSSLHLFKFDLKSIRKATKQEIEHLEMCEQAKKYVPYISNNNKEKLYPIY